MTTMREGIVSTIIAVYNRPQLVTEAVNSVLAQTYRPIEIVIVDDGSTDGTAAVCDAFAAQHPGVVQAVHQANTGLAGALNTGLRIITGEFVQFLDSDDLLMPEKFAHQVAGLRAHPECGISYCYTREYAMGEPWSGVPARRTGTAFETLFPAVLDGKIWPAPSPLYRRTEVDANGPYLGVSVQLDWEYECRAGARGVRLHHCPVFLADLRGTHRAEGRQKGGSTGPQTRDYADVLARIHGHARMATVSAIEWDHFSRVLFAAARKCAAAGFETEARRCIELGLDAAGPLRRQRMAAYKALSEKVGWQVVGQQFERIDHHRVMSVLRAVRRQPGAQLDLWRHRGREALRTVSGQPLAQWPALLRQRWAHRRSRPRRQLT